MDPAMSTIVIQESVRIPERVVDLDSFRQWAQSDEFPERGRFSYLNGEVWVDMSPEELLRHNLVKGEYAIVLGGMMKTVRIGKFFHDRTLVSNVEAVLSTEPDGTFVSFKSLKTGRVRLVEGGEGFLELQGSPDMTLEVVSASSVRKDTVVLRRLYWLAGIPEYWLVDARGNQLSFQILRHSRTGYVPARKRPGWQKSMVFGKSFKLTSQPDELEYPEYTLLVR